MSEKNKRTKKPNLNAVSVMVVEIERVGDRKVAKLHSARLIITDLFQGLNFDAATRVKNLRHLQTHNPRAKVTVHIRGRSPQKVPLNRVRLDPSNYVGDHPRLHIIQYGTLCHQPQTAHVSPA